MKKIYQMIMDDEVNPFQKLPRVTRFQIMTSLAYMWSAIFSAAIGSYLFFGTLVVFHTLVLVGLFITAYMFNKADQNKLNHRDAYRDEKDGCAKYDDIWGGA